MPHENGHNHNPSDESDRRSRYVDPIAINSNSLRERASSQPPRTTGLGIPSASQRSPSNVISSPWGNHQRVGSGLNPTARPIMNSRSSSYNVGPLGSSPQAQYLMAGRDNRTFDAHYEDDESEAWSESQDERYIPDTRGRTAAYDISRSRSQSVATGIRTGPIGSPFQNSGVWTASSSLNIPSNIHPRYNELSPPFTDRISPKGRFTDVNGNYQARRAIDPSNMSPFGRDLDQILRGDNPTIREIWPSAHTRDDQIGSNIGGSASRRHSVSVVQPRRESQSIVGFNAPANDYEEPISRPSAFHVPTFGQGASVLTDDELAADLGMLSFDGPDRAPKGSPIYPSNQASSLPTFPPSTSRSPVPAGRSSPYQSIGRSGVAVGHPFSPRQPHVGSPSESSLSGAGGSPPRSSRYDNSADGTFPQQQNYSLTARFIPGQGIQYLPIQRPSHDGAARSGAPLTSAYPNTGRITATQAVGNASVSSHSRQPSDNPSVADLGRGVPLHSVPSSWPLFIVEFKAGRTDLFYSTDLGLDLRVGDLVIVEADRGKDLGKVINDSITLKEVEEFQQQQLARLAFGDGHVPTSPGASLVNVKKEINPKKIYNRATTQDAQQLADKVADEAKALQLCQNKVRQRKLPMDVIDAEYQLDRKKLTFYYVAQIRVDFRELVRELFRLYKTRIWMAPLQGSAGFE